MVCLFYAAPSALRSLLSHWTTRSVMLQGHQGCFHPRPFSATPGHPVAVGGYAGTPLVVQDDAEEATVDGEPAVVAVVIDEAQLLELIDEMTDA